MWLIQSLMKALNFGSDLGFHMEFLKKFLCHIVLRRIYFNKKKSQIGVEYKILVCLRILGRGHDLDSVNEISLIPTSTCHYIFKQFIYNFSAAFYDRHVYMAVGDE